jgi:hypothetical protein
VEQLHFTPLTGRKQRECHRPPKAVPFKVFYMMITAGFGGMFDGAIFTAYIIGYLGAILSRNRFVIR